MARHLSARLVLGAICWLCCAGSAQANLCDARWWQSASAAGVQAAIRTGQSPSRQCPDSSEGDFPLHLAALFSNDAGAVQALIDAGASGMTPNGAGVTPIALFSSRYEQAVLSSGRADPSLTAISRVFDLQFEATGTAQNNLCSLEWWQSPSPDARNAVETPGVDLDVACDSQGNRPLHVALSIDHISVYRYNAISWLVYAGAGNIANRRGQTPLSLVEERYQRVLIEWDNRIVPRICRGVTGLGAQIDGELSTYYYLREQYAGESREQVSARSRARLVSVPCPQRP